MCKDCKLPELSESQTLEVFIEYEMNGLKHAVDLMNQYRIHPLGMANGMRLIKEKYIEFTK
jgi:hypothetical protein